MHRGVLADLERREVEPERPDLPAQVRELPERDALQAIRDERRLEFGELVVEGRGIRIAAGPRRRFAGQGLPASDAVARR